MSDLDCLTAGEILMIVRLIELIPTDGISLIWHDGKMILFEDHPDLLTLAEKVNNAANRTDVQEFLKELDNA